MRIEPYVLDDRVIIPDNIKKMSKEQIQQEIARLENEIRTKKVLDINDGQMNMIKVGRRSSFAQFSGHIKVFETLDKENILGHAVKRTKKISASLICTDMDYNTDEEINSGNVYEATATVQGEHEREKLLFAGLRFDDSDPVAGSITFEITDLELIRKLLTM